MLSAACLTISLTAREALAYRRWGERADFILQPALPRRAPKPALGQVLTGWKAIRRDESRLEVRSQLVCASFFDGHVTNRKKGKKTTSCRPFLGNASDVRIVRARRITGAPSRLLPGVWGVRLTPRAILQKRSPGMDSQERRKNAR